MSSFLKSKAVGIKAEELVLKILNRCSGLENVIVERKKYDIVTTGFLRFTTEVKFDLKEQKSGNIALEYYNTNLNKLSGILDTTANLWVQVLYPDFVWLANVKTIKKYIKKNKPHKVVKNVGDGNANLALYKSEIILADIFERIDNLDEYNLFIIIRKKLNER